MLAKLFAIVILVWLLVVQSLSLRAAEVKYFPVQSGDHPHDVAPAPDGTDVGAGQVTTWHVADFYPGEPVFVPRQKRRPKMMACCFQWCLTSARTPPSCSCCFAI